MLLQEEQYMIKWLSQYRTLENRQVVRLLKHSTEGFVHRALNRLEREGRIHQGDGYVGAEPGMAADRKLLDAIWVMLCFSDSIAPMAHYPAQYPSSLFFMKERSAYEVIVLEKPMRKTIKFSR